MDKNRRMYELSLAIVFVGLLFLISLFVLQNYEKEISQTPPQYIINNYNTYQNYETNPILIESPKLIYKRDYQYEKYDYVYNKYDEKRYPYLNYKKYDGQKTREDFLGTYVKEYYVCVLNKEKTGRYFTVIFKFEDQRGYEYSESITEYIKAGEKKKFNYRDIQFEREEIVD